MQILCFVKNIRLALVAPETLLYFENICIQARAVLIRARPEEDVRRSNEGSASEVSNLDRSATI